LVVSDDHLQAVELSDGRQVRVTAAFVRPSFVPNDFVLAGLDCDRHENGWLKVDAVGRTSVPGVWAAGNVANPRAQVVTAAGEGSAAAIAMNAELTNEDTDAALSHGVAR
jgi:thioredoxin reductase